MNKLYVVFNLIPHTDITLIKVAIPDSALIEFDKPVASAVEIEEIKERVLLNYKDGHSVNLVSWQRLEDE